MPRLGEIRLIVNPSASGVGRRSERTVTRVLDGHPGLDVVRTTVPGEATALARAAAEDGVSAVVVLGGDGTANEAAAGLVGTRTALACLPGGCTSVYARTLGMPGDLAAAAERISARRRPLRRVTVDTGAVDEHVFLFMAGVGITAAVMRAGGRRPEVKARLRGAYFVYGAATALAGIARGGLPAVEVRAGGETLPASTVVVQNADVLSYFGPRPVHACPGSGLTTGTLAAALGHEAGLADALGILGRLASGDPARVAAHARVEVRDGLHGLTVASTDGRPFPLEADGTWIGDRLSADFAVRPASLEVLTCREDLGRATAPLPAQEPPVPAAGRRAA
jgi:diacylglycerol kinase family enzyme